MNASHSLQVLLDVLAQRNIDLGKDDVAWAFESSQTQDAIVTYVDEYLSPTTLLSKEELQLYRQLPKLGRPENGAIIQQNACIPKDEDLEAAVAALEQSTRQIEQQCTLLEVQKAALVRLRTKPDATHTDGQAYRPDTRRKPSSYQNGSIDTTASAETRTHLQDAERRSKDLTRTLNSTADHQLDRDDLVFEGLQRLQGQSQTVTGDLPSIDHIENLCTKLATLQAASLRNRINLIYNDSLQDTSAHDLDAGDNMRSRDALAAELDSLMGEVDSVLQMGVDHQHRRPILQKLNNATNQALKDGHQNNVYTCDMLQHMTERLNMLAEEAWHSHSHTKALDAISSALSNATRSLPGQSHGIESRATRPAQEDSHEAKAALRYFDIRIPDNVDANKVQHILQSATSERQANAAKLAASTEQTYLAQLAQALTGAEADLQHLTQSLYAYTSFATPQLADWELSTRLEDLDKQTAEVGRQMAQLDSGQIIENARERQAALLHGVEW